MMVLYSYWRSTTAYRARIALNLKGVEYRVESVDLVAGAQRSEVYSALNPVQAVPSLVTKAGEVLTQSMAILEYLEETSPDPALLPQDPLIRARIRAAANVIATDIHPVNNLRVVNRIKEMGHGQDDSVAWMQHWMHKGFAAFATLAAGETPFAFGDMPGLADICLVPQLYNAHRWGVDLSAYPRLTEIEARCLALPEFDAAKPENQKDAA